MLLSLLVITSCDRGRQGSEDYESQVGEALTKTGQNAESISLPKIPFPVSTLARLPEVDDVMANPLSVIKLGDELRKTEFSGARSAYLAELMQQLDIGEINLHSYRASTKNMDVAWEALFESSPVREEIREIPPEWSSDTRLGRVLQTISLEIVKVRQAWDRYGGQPDAADLEAINAHLTRSIAYTGTDKEAFLIDQKPYYSIGARVNISELASALLRLFAVIESVLPELAKVGPIADTLQWDTPLGLIRIAGDQSDRHEGEFLLLIDLGGDDTYVDVGSALRPGDVSVIIDLGGNDKVSWKDMPGPGSGVFGMGLWLDMGGNDYYHGSNYGLGAASFGAGIFWDEKGDDVYDAGFLTQGVGQYGVGAFVDMQGNDHYKSYMAGQGFGGPGGVGLLVDFSGDDEYSCGGKIPDAFEARMRRHQGVHYFSMCQGYSFGFRPDISGGIGLLIDHAGDDTYKADIFSQGGAYWFGLGMLIDSAGNDRYEAYEHCQGESLHVGAGFLGDWSGNDKYIGYEHCQGVGMDRAMGVLYDRSGDDSYRSHHESQGAGLKPYGVGILIDEQGDDHYDALRDSQGFSKPAKDIPATQWPTGILLDLGGSNVFVQPYTDVVDSNGRIQNRRGIAIDKGRKPE